MFHRGIDLDFEVEAILQKDGDQDHQEGIRHDCNVALALHLHLLVVDRLLIESDPSPLPLPLAMTLKN